MLEHWGPGWMKNCGCRPRANGSRVGQAHLNHCLDLLENGGTNVVQKLARLRSKLVMRCGVKGMMMKVSHHFILSVTACVCVCSFSGASAAADYELRAVNGIEAFGGSAEARQILARK